MTTYTDCFRDGELFMLATGFALYGEGLQAHARAAEMRLK